MMRQLRMVWRHNLDFLVRRYLTRRAVLTASDTFFEGLSRDVLEHRPCYFVLSTGRCGTVWLTEVLRLSPTLDVHHAPAPELVVPSTTAYTHGEARPNEFSTAAFCARYDLLEAAALMGRTYVETNCRITFFARHVRSVFAGARFLHLIRHPLAFVRSAVARGYYQSARADRGHITPSGLQREQWASLSPSDKAAWNWLATNSFIDTLKHESIFTQTLTVRCEDMFSSLETVERVFTFLEADPPSDWRLKRRLHRRYNASSRAKGSDVRLSSSLRAWGFEPLAEKYGYDIPDEVWC